MDTVQNIREYDWLLDFGENLDSGRVGTVYSHVSVVKRRNSYVLGDIMYIRSFRMAGPWLAIFTFSYKVGSVGTLLAFVSEVRGSYQLLSSDYPFLGVSWCPLFQLF